MMDLWLIFNLLLPFMEVLLHTYMERATDEEVSKSDKDDDFDIHLPQVLTDISSFKIQQYSILGGSQIIRKFPKTGTKHKVC